MHRMSADSTTAALSASCDHPYAAAAQLSSIAPMQKLLTLRLARDLSLKHVSGEDCVSLAKILSSGMPAMSSLFHGRRRGRGECGAEAG